MARRSAGASAGDNSDELSIDAVCPNSDFLLIKARAMKTEDLQLSQRVKNIPMVSL